MENSFISLSVILIPIGLSNFTTSNLNCHKKLSTFFLQFFDVSRQQKKLFFSIYFKNYIALFGSSLLSLFISVPTNRLFILSTECVYFLYICEFQVDKKTRIFHIIFIHRVDSQRKYTKKQFPFLSKQNNIFPNFQYLQLFLGFSRNDIFMRFFCAKN